MATIERAIEIAAQAHAGQCDKAGDPYIFHPLRMMMRMSDDVSRITAVLHDVVEDGLDWTLGRLRDEGFSETIIEAVDGVTDRAGENYEAFIKRAAQNLISRAVKIADLEDNMNMLRLKTVGPKQLER